MMVAALPQTKRYTVDDLAHFPDDGKLRELAGGRIVEWDVTNLLHAFFITTLAGILRGFVLEHRLGLVVSADPLVRVLDSQHDARGPDVAFYARGRIPTDLTTASTATAPDLVIEVLSPSDPASEVQQKVHDWLRAGVRLLWYVDPVIGLTAVHHAGAVAYVPKEDPLDGADVVPGFSIRLQDVFDELAAVQGAAE